MSSNNYRELFDRLDKSENGTISREELDQGMQELSLSVDPSQVDSFFLALDIDGDGEISYPEFETFLTTHHPENSEKQEIYRRLNHMLPALKHISKLKATELFNEESTTSFDVVIKSKSTPNFDDCKTSLRVQVGFDDGITNSEIGDGSSALFYIKFVCNNGAEVANALKEHVESLREFIGELGEEASMIADTLNFETRQVADGAAIVVDLEEHPILGAYLGFAVQATESFKQFKPSVLLELGIDQGLEASNIVASKGMLRLNIQAKSVVDALLNNQKTPINAQINDKLNQAITKKMGIEVSTFLSLLNMESLNLELVMKDVKEDSTSTTFSVKETGSAFLEQMQGNPVFALVGAMEFLKDAVEVLKENGVESLSIGARAADVNAKIQIKANVDWALEKVFAEDEDDD